MKNSVYIGTSGWSYKDWRNVFYPAGKAQSQWLSYYATVFPVTEINSSFYRLPTKKAVEKWVEQVPQDFLFCSKLNRYTTHLKKLNDAEESLEKFFTVFQPMYQHMGPVLIQLPASVHYEQQKTEIFFQLLAQNYSEFNFSIEVRHASWLAESAIALMRKYNVGFVIAQSGGQFPYAEIITAKHIYLRFHGPGKLYASSYTDKELEYFAGLIRTWSKDYEVWAFFNNTMFMDAINNAKTLKEMVHSNAY